MAYFWITWLRVNLNGQLKADVGRVLVALMLITKSRVVLTSTCSWSVMSERRGRALKVDV